MAASDNLGSLQPPRIDNGIRSRMLFQGEAAANFSLTGGDHIAPRKLQFIVDNADRDRFIRSQHVSQSRSWNLGGGSRSDGSDDDNDDYDEEEDDLDEGDGLESLEDNSNIKNGNNSSGSVQSSSEKVNGLSRGIVVSNGNLSEQQHGGVSNYDNALTLVEPAMYCGQILMNERDGLGSVQNGFGGRKEEVDHEESLREHLLDPITGILMDDAMILPCGHSFGSGGMQNVFRMKACCRCSRPISENLVRPNLALRSAVQAFRREEGAKTLKRRDRVEQDKCNYDLCPMELRGKGVQFPFVVSDRVIIKGNKRTPPRFVGRVAVVTTQCLNGWYVVKTLDNAESVKLQYRSLEKVADDSPPNVNI